jgi:hypothetical protein
MFKVYSIRLNTDLKGTLNWITDRNGIQGTMPAAANTRWLISTPKLCGMSFLPHVSSQLNLKERQIERTWRPGDRSSILNSSVRKFVVKATAHLTYKMEVAPTVVLKPQALQHIHHHNLKRLLKKICALPSSHTIFYYMRSDYVATCTCGWNADIRPVPELGVANYGRILRYPYMQVL